MLCQVLLGPDHQVFTSVLRLGPDHQVFTVFFQVPSPSLRYFDLVIVIPSHAETDIDRRSAQRESWRMVLNRSGWCEASWV